MGLQLYHNLATRLLQYWLLLNANDLQLSLSKTFSTNKSINTEVKLKVFIPKGMALFSPVSACRLGIKSGPGIPVVMEASSGSLECAFTEKQMDGLVENANWI